MRIVHLADYWGPYAGSFVPMLRAVAGAARAEGWEVEARLHPVAGDKPWLAELEEEGLPHGFAPPTRSRRELAAWIGELLDESPEPTVLHTHYTTYDVPAVMAARRRDHAAVVWHVHSFASPRRGVALRNVAKHLAFGRGAARILCVTPEIAAALRRRLAPRGRVEFFPNAIDARRFPPPSAEERAAARRELRLEPEAPVALHFGWDWAIKGGDLFAAAVAELDPGLGAVALTVTTSDHALAACDRLGLGDRLRVVAPRDDVRSLYAAADAFVACSPAEGMPFAMLEALASGVGVAATDIPGHRLIGADLPACRLSGDEPAVLARAVESLLTRDRATAEAEGAASRRAIEAGLDVRPWAGRLVERYRSIAPAGTDPP